MRTCQKITTFRIKFDVPVGGREELQYLMDAAFARVRARQYLRGPPTVESYYPDGSGDCAVVTTDQEHEVAVKAETEAVLDEFEALARGYRDFCVFQETFCKQGAL